MQTQTDRRSSEVRGYQFYRQNHPLLTLFKGWKYETEDLFIEFYEHTRKE